MSSDEAHTIELPSECVNPIAATPEGLHAARKMVFPSLFPPPRSNVAPSMPDRPSHLTNCIAAPTLDAVNEHNVALVARLPGDFYTYLGTDMVPTLESPTEDEQVMLSNIRDLLDSDLAFGDTGSVPPRALHLKPYMPVVLLQSLGVGFAKGIRVVVSECYTNYVKVVNVDGVFKLVPFVTQGFCPRLFRSNFEIRRTQLPLLPAFAMTIHRLQGQSAGSIVVDLRRPCFCHGQLYVALSRATSAATLCIICDRSMICGPKCKVVHSIHPSLLRFADIEPFLASAKANALGPFLDTDRLEC